MVRTYALALAMVVGLSLADGAIDAQAQAPAESTAQNGDSAAASGNPQAPVEPKSPTAPRAKKHLKRPLPPPGTPRRVVVREGGASEPAEQIVPGMTPAEAARQRQDAEQWLSRTDAEVKQLGERKLTPQQEETVTQIRNYMDGARGALKEGDVRRASTLAEKAHLLSDDLLRH